MKKKEHPQGKEKSRPSSEGDAFLQEAEAHFAAWLEDPAPALSMIRSLSSEEQERVFLSLIKTKGEDIYPFFEALIGQEEKTDLALTNTLSRWISPEAGILLHRLAAKNSSKAVSKNIRKAIFRLKSQGLEVAEIGDPSPRIFRPPQPVPSEGFLSSLDLTGNRMIWLLRPQPPQGALAFQALVSDLQGMIDFQGFETSRKKFHEYLEAFRKEAPWEIVEAAPDYCLGLLIEAAEISQAQAQTPPGDFLKWRALMGTPPPTPLKPLIYLHLKEEEWKTRSDLLDRSGFLFQIPSFRNWFLEKEETKKYVTLLKEAAESRLVLTPYQKEARVMEIYLQAIDEVFDLKRRILYRRRMEEMSYVLWKTGNETDAQISLVAALSMESEGGVLSAHPFLLELVKRSLTAQLEEEAQQNKQKESDLLINP